MDTQTLWTIVFLTLLGTSFAIGLTIVIVFIRKATAHFDSGCCRHPLLLSSVSTMILSLSYIAVDWSRIYYAFSSNITLVSANHTLILMAVVNDGIYYCSTICLYVSIMLRLHSSFKNSVYELEKRQILITAFLIGLDLVAISLFLWCTYEEYAGNPVISAMPILSITTVIINDLLINFYLLYLFLKKLHHIIYTLDQDSHRLLSALNRGTDIELTNINMRDGTGSTSPRSVTSVTSVSHNSLSPRDRVASGDSNESSSANFSSRSTRTFTYDPTQSKTFDTKQQQIIDLITKIFLLTLVSFVAAQFFNVALMIDDYRKAKDESIETDSFVRSIMMCYVFRSIEACVNCVVLSFTFVFNQKEYDRCCKKFHSCLKHGCVTLMVRKNIEKRNMRLIKSFDESLQKPLVIDPVEKKSAEVDSVGLGQTV